MCLGIPGRIVNQLDNPHLVEADVFGVLRKINVGLIEEGVAIGDWVLLHVGFAVEKLDAQGVERAVASLGLVGADPDAATESVFADNEAEQEEVRQWAS